MAYIDRGGVRIWYETAGSGPTLLLTHGFSATSFAWQPQMAALSDAYQVVVWDIRGHGRSDSPEDPAEYSEALTVADMAAVLDAVDAERAVIGGLSLGGYLSLAFNISHPERVAGLVLCDTGPGYRRPEGRASWNRLAEGRARHFEKHGFKSLENHPLTHGRQHKSPRGLALAARGILPQHDARVIDSLPTIAVPTLVLVGEHDERFLAPTDYMADRIPGASKVILEGAGHNANVDQPEAFNAALRDFLASFC
jgi:pimeloyl-ACP methyl ester carboxylesterase